jgi:hypothetical protein
MSFSNFRRGGEDEFESADTATAPLRGSRNRDFSNAIKPEQVIESLKHVVRTDRLD